jgi:hypothetical protein
VAEIMAHFCPKLIDMNMFHPISATPQKVVQWMTLNTKTLSKIELNVPETLVRQMVSGCQRPFFNNCFQLFDLPGQASCTAGCGLVGCRM